MQQPNSFFLMIAWTTSVVILRLGSHDVGRPFPDRLRVDQTGGRQQHQCPPPVKWKGPATLKNCVVHVGVPINAGNPRPTPAMISKNKVTNQHDGHGWSYICWWGCGRFLAGFWRQQLQLSWRETPRQMHSWFLVGKTVGRSTKKASNVWQVSHVWIISQYQPVVSIHGW